MRNDEDGVDGRGGKGNSHVRSSIIEESSQREGVQVILWEQERAHRDRGLEAPDASEADDASATLDEERGGAAERVRVRVR